LTPLLSETATAAWSRAARRARAAGALVCLDTNYRRALGTPVQVEKAFAEIAHQVDVLFASPDEAALVCGYPDLDIDASTAVTLLAPKLSGTAEIVIKDGADGSLHFASDGTVTRGTALPVTIADLVGAGDAFAAGYLSALLDDEPVEERLGRAHACAAFVVASDGDWQGAPRRNELPLTAALAQEQVHR
jgi:2-dehydro-3-deoxygluconokinase